MGAVLTLVVVVTGFVIYTCVPRRIDHSKKIKDQGRPSATPQQSNERQHGRALPTIPNQGANPAAGGVYENDEYEILSVLQEPANGPVNDDAHTLYMEILPLPLGGVDGRVEAAAKTAEPDGKSATSTGDYTEIIPPVRPEAASGPGNDGGHTSPLYADILRS